MRLTTNDAGRNWRRAGVLAASFCLPLGCTDDTPDGPDMGTDGTVGPTTGDGDGDPMMGDGDPTGDGDPGNGCGPYPAGPYKWFDNGVVPPDTTFPAKYGPDGQEIMLSMQEVHDNCEEVKALAFVFGAND